MRKATYQIHKTPIKFGSRLYQMCQVFCLFDLVKLRIFRCYRLSLVKTATFFAFAGLAEPENDDSVGQDLLIGGLLSAKIG